MVRTFAELEQKKDTVKGKIVVYNQEWKGYDSAIYYRYRGGAIAAKYGAVGALVRSLAPFSVASVHTGSQEECSIPTAAITVEDAEMLQRMQDRGQTITLELTLESKRISNSYSSNLVFEIRGSERP